MRARLADRSALRDAFVLAEVLGKPRGLGEDDRFSPSGA
jgi:hypothetical protein